MYDSLALTVLTETQAAVAALARDLTAAPAKAEDAATEDGYEGTAALVYGRGFLASATSQAANDAKFAAERLERAAVYLQEELALSKARIAELERQLAFGVAA